MDTNEGVKNKMKAYTRWTIHYFVWNPRTNNYDPSEDFIYFESKEKAVAHFSTKVPDADTPQIELWEERIGTGGFVVRRNRIAIKDTSGESYETA